MDRQIQYPAQIPLVEDMLNAQRNAMVGIGHLAGGTFGANTVAASGFACAPGEGLTLTIAPGALLAPGVVDASAYGTLAAVSSALVRQFISRDPVTLAAPAAGATYIVSVTPLTVDTDDTVLPFYNAADPSVTYAGEGNSGLAAPTVRRDEAALSIGASVPEGSYPLWQIVVPAGAVAITTDMIAVASGAPFYPSLAAVAPRIVAPFNAQLAVAMGGYPLNAVVADPATAGTFWVSMADANVSTPGATGATWQSLFNGLATQAWANGQFLQLDLATLQQITGPVAFNTAPTVPNAEAAQNPVALGQIAGLTNGRLINIQKFTASGTYTPTSGATSAIGWVQGGGGASGAVPAAGSTQAVISGGGNGGAFCAVRFSVSADAPIAITVGSGGQPVDNAAGGNGGASSIGSIATAPGGYGGYLGELNTVAEELPSVAPCGQPSDAPTGTGIIYYRLGDPSGYGVLQNYTARAIISGMSGGSFFGSGVASTLATNGKPLYDPTVPGVGGGAVAIGATGPVVQGRPGAAGIVIIYEYA